MKKCKKQANLKVSVVIPTINSEKRIENTTRHIENYLKNLQNSGKIEDYEIILASQKSEDNTFEIIKKLEKNNKKIKALYLPIPGKGRGLNEGIRIAKFSIILMIDDDLSYPIEFLEPALMALDKDIIIGSRYLTKQQIPLKRKIAAFCYRKLVKLLFNLPVKDTQAGLKLIKKEVIRKTGLPKNCGWSWDIEFLWKAHRHGFKMHEIPIKYNFKENVLKIRKAAPKMFKDLVSLWLVKIGLKKL